MENEKESFKVQLFVGSEGLAIEILNQLEVGELHLTVQFKADGVINQGACIITSETYFHFDEELYVIPFSGVAPYKGAHISPPYSCRLEYKLGEQPLYSKEVDHIKPGFCIAWQLDNDDGVISKSLGDVDLIKYGHGCVEHPK